MEAGSKRTIEAEESGLETHSPNGRLPDDDPLVRASVEGTLETGSGPDQHPEDDDSVPL